LFLRWNTLLERKLIKYVAALDQGTTSTRCIIFDLSASIISMDQMEHQQIYPQPGWVEHNALEIWNNTQKVLYNAIHKAKIEINEIASIGITNQRETTVLWNPKTGQPYGNAIVWQDTRTSEICNGLINTGGQDQLRKKTGLPIATYFSGPKIKWLFDHDPELLARAKNGEVLFGNMDTWLIWNLTGRSDGGIHITDVTNASRTQLMNLDTLVWDQDILKLLNIPINILPVIKSSSEVYGESKVPIAGIPIAGDLGDQQAALFGQTCFEPGEAKNTYGTGCFMLMNTGTKIVPSKFGLLTTVGYKIGSQAPVYCLEGSIAITGALVQWLRDNLQLITKSKEIEELAGTVEDNGGIYFVPAFSGIFAPYWRSDARGVIVGMTRFINRGHFARAALEATAYQTWEVLDAMEKDSGIQLKSIKVDGGMVFNELLMQFQSDIINVPVIRPKITETTALGAAYASGLAVGFWHNTDQLKQNWAVDKIWNPAMDNSDREKLLAGWKKAVERSFNWQA
jgi:glycerol kinase